MAPLSPGYEVDYGTGTLSANATTATIPNPANSRSYTVKVRAQNSSQQWGQWSPTATVTYFTDTVALKAIYNVMGGYNWTNSDDWNNDNTSIENWYGVTLDSASRVRAIDLDENNLTGRIPAEFGDLT